MEPKPKKPKKPGPLPALVEPIRAVVLGIDPGSRSGWAILAPTGRLDAGDVRSKIEPVISRALEVAAELGLPLIVAAEKWSLGGRGRGDTHGHIGMLTGLNASWGRWSQALRSAGVANARVVRVTSMRWRARVIGGRQRKTEQWKADAIAAIRTRYEGLDLGPDAAEAACIATWASTAQEALAVVPKPRAPAKSPRRCAKRSGESRIAAATTSGLEAPVEGGQLAWTM